MSNNLRYVGKDFTPNDVMAKVTGAAKYADDILPDRLLHAKTVKSPYAHARVRSIDTSAAERMSGVEAVVTYEDNVGAVGTSEGGAAPGEPPLDVEPRVFGYPVAAVAAVDEYTAADAVEAIEVDYEVLDHVIDPIESLKPGGPNAALEGNALVEEDGDEVIGEIKWSDADFSQDFPANPGEWNIQWSWGDVQQGFNRADEVVEETLQAHPIATNPMEPRSNVAYWKSNDEVIFWGSSQSVGVTHFGLAGGIGVNPQDLTFISNYCGGGFGSKGATYPAMAVPALLSKKVNRPVKLRGSRKEEFHWGNGRASEVFKFRVGANSDGRITAIDVQGIGDGGAYSTGGLNALGSSFDSISATLQPETMRVRGVQVFTNTPKRWPMRGPGENQLAMALAPVLNRLSARLGVDLVDLYLANVPDGDNPGVVGADKTPMTSAYVAEAFEKAADEVGYDEIKGMSGTREGSKVYGVGVGFGDHGSGYVGLDGMVRIRTDGVVEVRTGVGNLGTYSTHASPRVVAETLDVPWEQVQPMYGDSTEGAFTQGQYGSNTTFTTTLAENVAAENAITYLQEIAAEEFGGSPGDFEVTGGEVRHTSDASQSLSLGEAAELAVDLGGKYSAEEIPGEDALNPMTLWNVEDIRGTGLVALGHSTPDMAPGAVRSFNAAIALVSVDVETGNLNVERIANIADCGRVLHPQSLTAQVDGGTVMGIGYAMSEHYNYDLDTGIPLNTDWYKNKPPTVYEHPDEIIGGAVNEPDPYGAYGVKGVGEPPYGAGASAVTSGVYDALGALFRNPPVTPSDVLDKIEAGDTEVM